MPEIQVPKELEEPYDRIVEVLYHGDESKALTAAIEHFVRAELKRLPSGEKFEHIIGHRLEVEADKETYSDKQISSAFEKLMERKKKLESFDFGKSNNKE